MDNKELKLEKPKGYTPVFRDTAKATVKNWLSRYGYELKDIKERGLDIIARKPDGIGSLGIFVRARSRSPGKEGIEVNVFEKVGEEGDQLLRFRNLCKKYDCIPTMAVYVETIQCAHLFLCELDHYLSTYVNTERKLYAWDMSEAFLNRYRDDPDVNYIRFGFEPHGWNP